MHFVMLLFQFVIWLNKFQLMTIFIIIFIWINVRNLLHVSKDAGKVDKLYTDGLHLSDWRCNSRKDNRTCSYFINCLTRFILLYLLQYIHSLRIRFDFHVLSFWKHFLFYQLITYFFFFFLFVSQILIIFLELLNFKHFLVNFEIYGV